MSSKRTLVVGVLEPLHPDSLDPYDSLDFVSMAVADQMYERPYVATASEKPEPQLFTQRLTTSGSRLVAQLRPTATFSDGSPVTSLDVVRSLSATGLITRFADIEAGPDGIGFRPRGFSGSLEHELSKPWCAISKRVAGRPTGSGPFALDPQMRGEDVALVRNEHYDGKPAWFERVELRCFARRGGVDGLCDAMLAGDVHLTWALDRTTSERLSGLRRSFQPGDGTAMLWFNTDRLRDGRVRRALCSAIDRYAITQSSYSNPAAFTARAALPPRMGSARDNHRYDPEAARELLRQAEFGDRRLNMLVIWGTRGYLPDPMGWAKEIQRQLAQVGLQVELEQTKDPVDYQRQIRANRYDLLLGGWSADTNDPADFLEALLDSAFVPAAGDNRAAGCNFGRWANRSTDQALVRFRRERSDKNEAAVLDTIREDPPFLALAYGPAVIVHTWDLQGVVARRSAYLEVDLADLSRR
ncbi:MAG: ABC transporter substrate-binding protein [Myxococcales bacterium FL481]|nr:MAG: ABC transporter substrate-binding protein [Myxococcales bacterium FL481]